MVQAAAGSDGDIPWSLSRIDRRVLALQRRQVLTDRPLGRQLVAPVDFAALDPLVAAGVGRDHAGIDGKACAADQPDLHARRHHDLGTPAETRRCPGSGRGG